MNPDELKSIFKSRFKSNPRAFRAPGKICLMGDHTDYHHGLTLTAGIDKEICLLLAANSTNKNRIYSHDFDEYFEFEGDNYKNPPFQWLNFVVGIIDQLKRNGMKVGGFDCVFEGDIPMGVSMSSSAAIGCAMAFAINEVFDLGMTKGELATIAYKSEDNFEGDKYNLSKHLTCFFAEPDQLIKIDCQNLSYDNYTSDLGNHELVLINPMATHTLVATEYNTRKAECKAVIDKLNQLGGEHTTLRDVSLGLLELNRSQFERNEYKRAKFVIEESARVNKVCSALLEGDYKRLGELFYKSHEGLRYDYMVSCKEIDFLIDATMEHEEIIGARMMGVGFGGCTINLVEREYVDQVMDIISEDFLLQFEIKPEVYRVKLASGVSEIGV